MVRLWLVKPVATLLTDVNLIGIKTTTLTEVGPYIKAVGLDFVPSPGMELAVTGDPEDDQIDRVVIHNPGVAHVYLNELFIENSEPEALAKDLAEEDIYLRKGGWVHFEELKADEFDPPEDRHLRRLNDVENEEVELARQAKNATP